MMDATQIRARFQVARLIAPIEIELLWSIAWAWRWQQKPGTI